jgi:hypothetical protein
MGAISWLRFPAGIRYFAAGIQSAVQSAVRIDPSWAMLANRLCWPIRLLGFKRSHSNPCAVETKKAITSNLPVTHLAQSHTASHKGLSFPPSTTIRPHDLPTTYRDLNPYR